MKFKMIALTMIISMMLTACGEKDDHVSVPEKPRTQSYTSSSETSSNVEASEVYETTDAYISSEDEGTESTEPAAQLTFYIVPNSIYGSRNSDYAWMCEYMNFNNGYALIPISSVTPDACVSSVQCGGFACIDTSGDVQYILKTDDFSAEFDFDGGQLGITSHNHTSYRISPAGEILYSAENTETLYTQIFSHYTCITEHQTGFEASEPRSYLLDENGNEIFTLPEGIPLLNSQCMIDNCGSGVFRYVVDDGGRTDGNTYEYYSTKDNLLLPVEGTLYTRYDSDNDYPYDPWSSDPWSEYYTFNSGAILAYGWHNTGELGDHLIYSDGRMAEIECEDYIVEKPYMDGYVALDCDGTPSVYNFDDSKLYAFDALAGHDVRVISSNGNGLLAYTAEGDDGKSYYVVYDSHGNTVKELSEQPEEYGEIIDVDSTYVYFENGRASMDGSESVYEEEFTRNDQVYDGWALCEIADAQTPYTGNMNYVNAKGEFLLPRDVNGYTCINVMDDVPVIELDCDCE